jgi:extracellular factor (EF) 3-hydroxypalmitic acid methyl ester biosynthesis protein
MWFESLPVKWLIVTEKEMLNVVRPAAEQLAAALACSERSINEARRSADAEYESIATAITSCLRRLSDTGLVGLANRLPSSELWNCVGEILCRGWLQNRARTKPRGYAGDYEILAAIYENRRCDDPLGTHFDRYFQEEAAPQAVRNRMHLMRDRIVAAARGWQAKVGGEELRVAMVGSAFGLELRDALAILEPAERRKLKFVLLDLDPAALEFARQTLQPWLKPAQVDAIPTNIFRLAARPSLATPLAGSHLLFCPGLFDYLDDDQAVAMLSLFWNCLAPTGQLIVFQFAALNPSRAYMEWLGNWYLTYRDDDELRQLAARSALPAVCTTFGAEPLGVDLWVAARRS